MKALSSLLLFASALSLTASPVMFYNSFGDDLTFDSEQSYTIGTSFVDDNMVSLVRGQSFVADDDYTLTSAQLAISINAVGVPSAVEQLPFGDSLLVTIRADDFDQPGEILVSANITEFADVEPAVVEVVFESGVQLDFGSQYWLVLETGNQASFTNYFWHTSPNDVQALGASGSYSDLFEQEPSFQWDEVGISNEPAFALYAQIPEPSAYAALAAFIALGIGLWRRTRK